MRSPPPPAALVRAAGAGRAPDESRVPAALRAVVDRFAGLRVAVVGDAVLDRYLSATARRLSREAPVPVSEVEHVHDAPGSAANTAAALAALGAATSLLGVVGDDDAGRSLARTLRSSGVDTSRLVVSAQDATTVKNRLLLDGAVAARFDTGTRSAVSAEAAAEVARLVGEATQGCDALLVSDDGSGVLDAAVVEALRRLRRDRPGLVLVVDAKQPGRYRDLAPTACKPDDAELRTLLDDLPEGGGRPEHVEARAAVLHERTGAAVVAATLDADGAVVLDRDSGAHRTWTRPAPPSRTCGAGDTYVAALTCALTAGADTASAAEVAAAAAEVVTADRGTTTCTAAQLRERVCGPTGVVVDADALAARVEDLRALGRRVVFTNGCFDLLHPGHVSYLSRAKALGNVLVVAVNSDASVARLKGPSRPVNPWEDRAAVLAGLSSVDVVVGFDEDSPAALLERLRPDVYAKGGDYDESTLPEAPVARRVGARIAIVPFVEERSTTSVVARIAASVADAAGQVPDGAPRVVELRDSAVVAVP